jgi:hypothetical protein
MHCILRLYLNIMIFGPCIHGDWASNFFLHMTLCKGCSLAKIQQLSLLLINKVSYQHFAYEVFHNGGFLARYPKYFAYVALY